MGIELIKTAISTSGLTEETMKKCSGIMQKFKFGSLCYLSSGNASEKSTLNGNKIEFEVLTDEGKEKAVCLDYFKKYCTIAG